MKATILNDQKQELKLTQQVIDILKVSVTGIRIGMKKDLIFPMLRVPAIFALKTEVKIAKSWQGFYGPRMTAASVRLNTPLVAN